MKKKTLKIHSENILPVIKKWLYSEKDIFLRELVSNAQDAITKLEYLRKNGNVTLEENPTFQITLALDKEKKTLTVSDNGIGMSHDEVEKYICQVAFSGAKEFIDHYTTDKETDQIIGHFGLGFYSAFMVSSKVEIFTKSFKHEEPAIHWSSNGETEYEITETEKKDRGTSIVLHLSEEEFLDPSIVRNILKKYCSFLPYPISFEGSIINEKPPLWLKKASETTDEEVINFYQSLYPMKEKPVLWVQLNIDHPFHLQGILFFPKITPNFDFHKQDLKLYCNRVFVTDQVKDLFPDFLRMMEGAIDSSDIPLNVSRSFLQMDSTVRKLNQHIIKKVCDKLSSLAQTEPEKFTKLWKDLEVIVKLGMLHDDKFFERAKDFFVFKTIQGDFLSLKDLRDQKELLYADENASSTVVSLYQEMKEPVVYMSTPLDLALISLLEQKLGLSFKRIDSQLHEKLLDPSKEKTLLDENGKNEAQNLSEYIKTLLNVQDLQVEAKSLSTDKVSSFLQIDESSRRFRDYFGLRDKNIGTMPVQKTFVINTNHPLIQKIQDLKNTDGNLAKDITVHLYKFALFSQNELPRNEVSSFMNEWNELLVKLTAEEARR